MFSTLIPFVRNCKKMVFTNVSSRDFGSERRQVRLSTLKQQVSCIL